MFVQINGMERGHLQKVPCGVFEADVLLQPENVPVPTVHLHLLVAYAPMVNVPCRKWKWEMPMHKPLAHHWSIAVVVFHRTSEGSGGFGILSACSQLLGPSLLRQYLQMANTLLKIVESPTSCPLKPTELGHGECKFVHTTS